MKTALALLLSFAAVGCAQDRSNDDKSKKRLSSVTWDLKSHKLIWEVDTGRSIKGQWQTQSTARYEITPEDAVMKVQNERRAFTQEEAVSLQKLLDTLSLYCAESVVWWDQGQGRKLPDSNDAPAESDADRIKVKNEVPSPLSAPALASALVALSTVK